MEAREQTTQCPLPSRAGRLARGKSVRQPTARDGQGQGAAVAAVDTATPEPLSLPIAGNSHSPAPPTGVRVETVITRARFVELSRELGTNRPAPEEAQKGKLELPPRIARLVAKSSGHLPDGLSRWVESLHAGAMNWCWHVAPNATEGELAAGLALESAYRLHLGNCALVTIGGIVSSYRQANRYGSGSKDALLDGIAEPQVLALIGLSSRELDSDALASLEGLLRRRADKLKPTLLVAEQSGSSLFREIRRKSQASEIVTAITGLISDGIAGFEYPPMEGSNQNTKGENHE